MNGNNITFLNHFIKCNKLYMWILCLDCIRYIGIAGNNFGAKATVKNVMQISSGSAESIQPQRQVSYVRWKQILTFWPVPFPNFFIIIIGVSDQAHNHGTGKICQFLCAESRKIQHDNAMFCCCIQINGIHANAKALNKFQIRKCLDYLSCDWRISRSKNGYSSLASRDNLFLRGKMAQLQFNTSLCIGLFYCFQFFGSYTAIIFIYDYCFHV